MAWGSYFDYVAEWDKYIDEENIIAISYEELQEVRFCDIKVVYVQKPSLKQYISAIPYLLKNNLHVFTLLFI